MANLASQPEPFKVALFLDCFSENALKVYNGLLFESEEDRQNLTEVIKKLDEYAIGEVNETYERFVFKVARYSFKKIELLFARHL